MDLNSTEEQNNYNSSWLFDFVLRNLKPLIIIGITAFIVSLIIAFMLPSRFRATVVLFPATSEPISKSLLAENQAVKGLLNFGTADEVEQFLQVLYSEDIRKKITRKYDLFTHYNIDTTEKYPNTRLSREYDNNISFRSTEYLSIEIEVFDKDPKLAAAIANDIADYADSTINNMQHERAQKAYKLVEFEYNNALKELDFVQDSLQKLRDLGVFNYEAQSEVFSDAYAIAIAKGNKEGIRDLEEKFKILAKYGGAYQNFSEMILNETKRISQLKQKFVEAKMDAEQNITHKFVVSRAEAPEKEYYPIRWLIVLGSVLSALLFGAVVLSIAEQLKKKALETPVRLPEIKTLITQINKVELFNYDNMESFFKNKGLIEVINHWKIHLAVITIVSAAIGIFVSSPTVITPKFKSTAILYPVNIYTYSEESTTEQMLQVLNSNDIKEKMLKTFDLLKHYKIDPKDKQYYSTFLGEYDDNVNVSKTEYESVEVRVMDKDPKIACNMVDSIISYYDQKIAALHRKKHGEAMDISEKVYLQKSHELDSLENKLNEVRTKYGILNYGSQANEATKGEISGNNAAKELFKNLQEQGAYSQRLDTLVWYARRDFLYFKNQYETEKREIAKKISYSQVISAPIISDKKAYPVRWAIVAITVIASLIFSLIAISFIESKRKKA